MSNAVPAFDGSVAARYDQYLRPLLFEPYAKDVAGRLDLRKGLRVLEIASGTGIVTRQLLRVLPGDATLVATDLSEQMLTIAQQQVPRDSRLAFQPADGMQLPFNDSSFDAVICQFGLMFFPDKSRGLSEMRRVLTSGGQLLLSTWDALRHNPAARFADATVKELVPDSPPAFLEIPYHMHDAHALEQLVRDAGFADVSVETVDAHGHCASSREAATGLVLGTPLAVQLAERSIPGEPIVDRLEAALAREFGPGPIAPPLRALIVSARA